jgi:hypothetical protein
MRRSDRTAESVSSTIGQSKDVSDLVAKLTETQVALSRHPDEALRAVEQVEQLLTGSSSTAIASAIAALGPPRSPERVVVDG